MTIHFRHKGLPLYARKPEFWLAVQEDYNLAQARKRVDTARAIWPPKAPQPA